MARLVENKSLALELPKIQDVHSSGGGFPLSNDPVENWAWFKNSFTEQEIDAIKLIGKHDELERASTFGGSDPKIRDSFVKFIFPNSHSNWIFARLAQIINGMNDQFFKFDLYGMDQGIQFTQYSAPGEHYDWHIDRGMLTGTRKLSLVVQLSDPSTYEGGELELWFGGEPTIAPKEQGMMILFPSYVMHRVKPVTSGVRNSLVCWISGPPFK